jgi:hypothetical protein
MALGVLALALAVPAAARADLMVCCPKIQTIPDVRATGLEVTQSVQTDTLPALGSGGFATYSGVELVAHRTTVVRLYANVASGVLNAQFVGAELYATRGGHPLPGSPLSSDDGLKTLTHGSATPTIAERGDSRSGFTFTLPDSWTTGKLTLRGQLVPIGLIYAAGGECATPGCEANDRFQLRGVSFASTGTERVLSVKLRSSSWPAVPKPKVALAYPEKLEPLADGALQFDHNSYATTLDITKIGDVSTIADLVAHCTTLLGVAICAMPVDKNTKASIALSELADASLGWQLCKDIGTPAPCPDEVAGVDAAPLDVSPKPFGEMSHGALNKSGLPAVVINGNSPQGDAHELGHGTGRAHASGACGASAKSSPFDDWPPDQMGFLDSIGLDLKPGSGTPYGGEYRAIAPRAITGLGSTDVMKPNFNPDQWFDYMGYCPKLRELPQLDNWISAKGWDDEFDSLRAYGSQHGRLAAAAKPVAGLHVIGFEVAPGPLVLWSVRPATAVVPADAGAGYRAVVRGRDGQALASAPLRADFTHIDDPDNGPVPVVIVDGEVPLPAAAGGTLPASVGALEVDHYTDPPVTRARSAHAPTVTLVAPSERTKLAPGAPLAVSWHAADADGDTLLASVDYSADGGHSFHTVWSGPSTGAATIPGETLTGSARAVVRVRIGDGFDQASAVSSPFRAPGRAPDVTITSPVAGQSVPADVPLRLAGSADDDRFAALSGRALRWTLGRRTVAVGERAALRGLRPGDYTLGLVATDRAGRSRTASVKISVQPVTPQPLLVQVLPGAAAAARAVRLRVTAVTPCRLTISGGGVRPQTVAVTRAPRDVRVSVTPGKSPLKLVLTFRSGRYGTRDAIVVPR